MGLVVNWFFFVWLGVFALINVLKWNTVVRVLKVKEGAKWQNMLLNLTTSVVTPSFYITLACCNLIYGSVYIPVFVYRICWSGTFSCYLTISSVAVPFFSFTCAVQITDASSRSLHFLSFTLSHVLFFHPFFWLNISNIAVINGSVYPRSGRNSWQYLLVCIRFIIANK